MELKNNLTSMEIFKEIFTRVFKSSFIKSPFSNAPNGVCNEAKRRFKAQQMTAYLVQAICNYPNVTRIDERRFYFAPIILPCLRAYARYKAERVITKQVERNNSRTLE